MTKRNELAKIILSQLLAIYASYLLVSYVFFPDQPKVRASFKNTLHTSPKKVVSAVRDISAFFTRSRTIALPPPWKIPASSSQLPDTNDQRPPDTDNRLPTIDNQFPTTYPGKRDSTPQDNPPPTTSPRATPSPSNGGQNNPPPSATSVPPPPTSVPQQVQLTLQEQEIVNLINSKRSAEGLSSLSINIQLTKAARDHSRDIGQNDTCGHTGSNGSTPPQRASQAGFSGSFYGETVACGYSTQSQVVDGWWKSPGHHAILTNSGIKVIGLGTWSGVKRATAMVGY